MLGGVRDREPRGVGKVLHRSLALGQDIEHQEPGTARKCAPDLRQPVEEVVLGGVAHALTKAFD